MNRSILAIVFLFLIFGPGIGEEPQFGEGGVQYKYSSPEKIIYWVPPIEFIAPGAEWKPPAGFEHYAQPWSPPPDWGEPEEWRGPEEF